MAQPHRVAATVPAIEVTDHRHALRVRCPDCETHAFDAFNGHLGGAERAHRLGVALVNTLQQRLIQQRTERICVMYLLYAIGEMQREQRDRVGTGASLEQARKLSAAEVPAAAAGLDHLHSLCVRHQRADHTVTAPVGMRAQPGERIGREALRQGVHLTCQRRNRITLHHHLVVERHRTPSFVAHAATWQVCWYNAR